MPDAGEIAGASYSCYKSGSSEGQLCNIGATQELWYNATRVRSDDVGGCCWQFGYSIYGTPASCTTAQIKTVVKDIRVRFSDRTLWPGSTAQSAIVYGSSNQACFA
jgi:hypothetical protein